MDEHHGLTIVKKSWPVQYALDPGGSSPRKPRGLNLFLPQLSFSTFVFPNLVLAYLGQGARLARDGDAVIDNIFYATIPGSSNGPLFWFAVNVFILSGRLTPFKDNLCLRDPFDCEFTLLADYMRACLPAASSLPPKP